MTIELSHEQYSKLSPEERLALSLEALENLITSTREVEVVDEEGKIERKVFQPVSAFLTWVKSEAESIVTTTPESFDQPLTKEQASKRLSSLQERYNSLETILGIVIGYLDNRKVLLDEYRSDATRNKEDRKVRLVYALDLYHQQFIKKITTYLEKEPQKTYRENKILPLIPNAMDLPLSLLTLSSLQHSILKMYLHDLRGIIGGTANRIKYELGSPEDATTLESYKSAIEYVQKSLVRLVEFHKQFDFDTITYQFTISTLHKFRGAVYDYYAESPNTSDERSNLNVRYSFEDQTRATLSSFLQQETGKPNVKPNIDEYSSFLSQPFLITLFYNCAQNFERVNRKLIEKGRTEQITAAKATLFYELQDEPEKGFVPDQMVITDADGNQKGVWITLKVQDNGPGFPAEPDDQEYMEGEKNVRSYTPEFDKSTHGGDGIGLATMKQNVKNANGIFKTYTDLDNGGAAISVSFPLLRKPLPPDQPLS